MSCQRTDAGYFTREHRPDCRERACSGCAPCERDDHGTPVRHCEHRKRCTSHLAAGEYACPKCLAKIRGNLTRIVDTTALMIDEAVETGVDSEAASLAGPVANVVTSRWRRVNAARAGEWIEETDWTHPAIALGEWERVIREDLGHDAERLVSDSLSASAGYLDWVLTDLARDEGQALVLADLAAGLAQTLAHLEGVLHDSRSPERGAPCPACEEPAPRLARHWATWDTSGAQDYWQCPRDKAHEWTEGEYRKWVADDYLGYAEWLPARDLEQAHGVKAGTLRQWAARQQIRRKQSSAGLWLYDVDRAIELRDGDTLETA